MKVHTGKLDASGMRVGIVVGRFNDVVASRLLEGAIDSLVRHGADAGDIEVAWVPGSFEIPLAAQELAATGRFDALVCLGVVIRGETAHFEYVAGEASRGAGSVALGTRVPVGFGILTTDNMAQAMERAGGKAGNKGSDAALAAVEMVSLLRGLRSQAKPRRVGA